MLYYNFLLRNNSKLLGSAPGTLNSNIIKKLIKAYACKLSNLMQLLCKAGMTNITLKSIQQAPRFVFNKYLPSIGIEKKILPTKKCVFLTDYSYQCRA